LAFSSIEFACQLWMPVSAGRFIRFVVFQSRSG
jgi:hypothetical protein